MLQPRVTDISHHNTVTDLRASGLWAVIHKATQGSGYRDPTYAKRRQQASSAGMLWGAYHFGDNTDIAAQVANYLGYAVADDDTLLCLDYEDHPSGSSKTMRPQQMVAFLREIERRTGRKAVLYSGNRIKEDIRKLNASDRDYVCSHRLWLCQYGSKPQLPTGFDRSWLWQYTDGRVGPEPHRVPGITGDVDLNAFNGSREELAASWAGPRAAAPQIDTDLSARRRGTDEDTESSETKPARGSDDTTELPPFLRASQPQSGGLNVQPEQVAYSLETEMLQTKLIAIGYHEIGVTTNGTPDGKWGGKTRGAVTAFMNDRGRSPDGLTTDYGFVNPDARAVVTSEISRAVQDRWTRPIAPMRANATEKDIAPTVESVKVSLWGRFSAKVAGAFAAIGITGSTLSNVFQSVQDTFYPVRNFFAHVPPEVWFILMGVVAYAAYYVTNRAAKAATKDYNTGRLN